MAREGSARVCRQTLGLLSALLCATFFAQSANAQQPRSKDAPCRLLAGATESFYFAGSGGARTAEAKPAIPSGTILPVRLNSTLSSENGRKGQVITGRVMQDVVLAPGVKIKEGAKVSGHIVEVRPAVNGSGALVSFQFDRLLSSHQTISIITNLRAIAGFMRILEAQTPPIGPGEGDVYSWLTTVQVGGDVVYGEGGQVTSGKNPGQVVGKAVAGGVLGKALAKEGTSCRGAVDGNDAAQSLWVFSSDACGTYGLEDIRIAHAGRSEPIGVIVLVSPRGNLKLRGGAGMLLRVRGSS